MGIHLGDHRDLRSQVPSLVLIYPLDQHHLKSGFLSQEWMLKLCCMHPGEEHTLETQDDDKGTETNPALGVYRLKDLGEHAGPVIKWMSGKAKILKIVSPRLGSFLEWVHKDEVTSFLKSTGEKAKDISLPESALPKGGGKFLPISSEMITLAGLNEGDYRELEGQGLIFLQQVFQKHQLCGNLHLFVHESRMLWLCKEHKAWMEAERDANAAAGRKSEELWQNYRDRLSENVRKVWLLGEEKSHELKEVFVELSISEEYQRPSARKEYLGFMDAALRERRSLFRSESFGEQEKEKRMVRPDELLRDGTRAVITGAPGCGKSTLLRWLGGKALTNAHRLPVFLELKSINQKLFDDCRGSLAELLFEQAIAPLLHFEHPSERERLKAEFTAKLAKLQVAVFLDGLDEVRNAEFFRPLCDGINHFIGSEYGRNLLIISTRPYALDVRFQDAKEMEIAPLNQRQTADFLRHYYGNDPQLDVNALIRKLQRRELSEMIRVPVLLGALVRRYREKGELTGDPLKLYEGLVRDLAVMVDREKNVSRYSFSDREGRRNLEFLERIAFKKLFAEQVENDAERLTFDGDWILDEAKEFCAGTKIDPYDFAADVKATPLLREVAEEVWAFSHLTIQEYLAAKVIAGRSDCEQIICRAYFNPTLVEMEALPMALGMAKRPDELYRAIERLPDSLNFVGVRLRARGLAYGADISDDLCEQLADRLVEFVNKTHIEETGYSDAVIRGLSGISGLHSDQIGKMVAPFLDDDGSFAPARAADTLGKIGGDTAIAALIKVIKPQSGQLYFNAVSALVDIGGENAAAALI
ncbi:MAG: NACHT domain-containing protein, partial [Acidobacteriota bacterium]|nr:NACHT domain-containing protein [Acidobacteriota bacterium]